MEKGKSNTSKKYVSLLCLTILSLCLLSVFASQVVRFTMVNTEFRSVRSGIFLYSAWGITYDGWHFSAVEANGSIVFFAYLDWDSLGKLSISGDIETGSVTLSIVQGENEIVYELSQGNITLNPDLIGDGGFEAGRIQMSLNFENVGNLLVDAIWNTH